MVPWWLLNVWQAMGHGAGNYSGIQPQNDAWLQPSKPSSLRARWHYVVGQIWPMGLWLPAFALDFTNCHLLGRLPCTFVAHQADEESCITPEFVAVWFLCYLFWLALMKSLLLLCFVDLCYSNNAVILTYGKSTRVGYLLHAKLTIIWGVGNVWILTQTCCLTQDYSCIKNRCRYLEISWHCGKWKMETRLIGRPVLLYE